MCQTSLDDFTIKTCKYCGKPFIKHKSKHRLLYCSDVCRFNARREQKAAYQAKRRLLIKHKELVVDEKQKYDLGSYGTSSRTTPLESFKEEHKSIIKEKKRLKI